MNQREEINIKKTSSGGVGFFGLLTLLFIYLKLTNAINWSWWLVLSPLFIPATIILTIVIGAVLIGIILALTK